MLERKARSRAADINLNLNNIYFNQEFYDALDEARKGGDPLLLTQMLAGLTLVRARQARSETALVASC